jgi:hypothetical protein
MTNYNYWVELTDYDYWGELDADRLYHTTPEDAIEELIDETPFSEWGSCNVEVFGWRREKKPQAKELFPAVLEFILEELDFNYELGDPENVTIWTPAMEAAAIEFCRIVLQEYNVWPCRPDMASKITVNALEWVKQNAPGWLEGESAND